MDPIIQNYFAIHRLPLPDSFPLPPSAPPSPRVRPTLSSALTALCRTSDGRPMSSSSTTSSLLLPAEEPRPFAFRAQAYSPESDALAPPPTTSAPSPAARRHRRSQAISMSRSQSSSLPELRPRTPPAELPCVSAPSSPSRPRKIQFSDAPLVEISNASPTSHSRSPSSSSSSTAQPKSILRQSNYTLSSLTETVRPGLAPRSVSVYSSCSERSCVSLSSSAGTSILFMDDDEEDEDEEMPITPGLSEVGDTVMVISDDDEDAHVRGDDATVKAVERLSLAAEMF